MTSQDESGEQAVNEHDVVELVARCLQRIDESTDPPSRVVEAFCEEHPEHAPALRRRLAYLERAGLAAGAPRTSAPRKLGRFELKGELGRGGMGVVYDAHDPRLDRRVALKALGPRLVVSDRARTRFEREIRAVAGLHHPRIVPVYEVGEENGVPWYTMELIEGRTLAQVIQALKDLHLRSDELNPEHLGQATFFERGDTDSRLLHDSDSTSGALALDDLPTASAPLLPKSWGKTYVETVCRMVHDVADALEHAHAQGVVHRDVKPSNVLVDSRGRALLFDFGLARIEDDEALTMTGDFAGTPFYVAPEQVSGKRTIDLRADVYSLGVTLFELLTLRRPFTGRNSQVVFRQILSKDPPLLRRINRLVPRDLETICLTALEKDPARRYQTAGELAADLRRFLEFRPIRARPVSVPTRAWRWARRHPGFATAGVLATLITIGVPTAMFFSNVALAREAERTAREAEKASRINRFLLGLLGTANPNELGIDGTIREAIDLAVARVDSNLDDPEIQAGVLATIGNTYLSVGEVENAEPLLRQALVLRRGVLPADHPELIASLDDLGRCRHARGDLPEARALFEEALAVARGDSDQLAELRAQVLRHVALLHAAEGHFALARERAATALTLAENLFGGESAEFAEGLLNLGDVLAREAHASGPPGPEDSGSISTAETVYRDAMVRLIRLHGPDHPDTLSCRERLAGLLMRGRQYKEGAALYKENVAAHTARLGPRHAVVGRTRSRYALAMHLSGANDASMAEAREALAIQLDVLPAGHGDIAETEVVLAQILLDADLPEEASLLLEDAVEIRRARGQPERVADALQRLARSYYDQVRLEETVSAGEEALALYAEMEDPEEELAAGASRVVALASMGLGRWDEALRRMTYAVETFERLRGENAASTVTYREDLANVYFVQGLWGHAARTYRAALDGRRAAGTMDQPIAISDLVNLAEAEARLGRTDAAIEAAREAVERHESRGGGLSPIAARGLLIEGRMLAASGRTEEALTPLYRGTVELLSLGDRDQRAAFDAARLYARSLMELGRLEEAEHKFLETLDSTAAFLGPGHPDVRLVARDLAELRGLLGEDDELAYLRGVVDLSYKLKDSGSSPGSGGIYDRPIGYGPD